MKEKRYAFELTGMTSLLMHNDNVEWCDHMEAWLKDNKLDKTKSKAGDDRKPGFTWIGCLYHDAGKIVIPSDNLMTMLREGGAMVSTGKGSKTYKQQTQSGILVDQVALPLLIDGKEVPFSPFGELEDVEDFEIHKQMAQEHGFELFVKRARIGQSKHVRVRPRFNNWSVRGTMTVMDESITKDVLQKILTLAGARAGLGDWRPSSPSKPGSFGKFEAKLDKI